MEKYMRYGGIFVFVLIILFLLNELLVKPMPTRIKEYLLQNGYIPEGSIDDSLLFNTISNNITNRFSLADFTFSQNINEKGSMPSILNQTYNYKTHELNYNYRIQYNDNINVIIRGAYINNNFTCNKEFSSATLSQSEINNACKLVQIKVERFYKEAKVLFTNYKFIEYMENN